MADHTPDSAFSVPVPAGLPIGETWIPTHEHADVVFPFDGSVVGSAPIGTPELARQALAAGAEVKPAAARLSGAQRREILTQIAAELAERGDELIEILIAETGKPRVDCQVEMSRTVFTWQAAADEVAHLHGETVPLDMHPSGAGMLGYWTRRPIGLVIGVAGFNYPLLLASHKIAPAIAAGCPVICKPAPATPLATLWLVDICRRAAADHGAPEAIVQLLTGDADVGETLVTAPEVDAVSFTGSAAVGHTIAKAAAPRKVLLELGSNTALVVAPDADIDAAVDAVIRGGYYANGQACISVQRLIVCDPVAAEFTARLTERVRAVKVGDPRDPDTRVAPLINEAATARALSWIEAATKAGATVLAGGERSDDDWRSIQPTLLADVPEDAQVWCEEVFAPVVVLRTVADIDEAYACVNRSHYGLHASVFTESLSTAMRAVEELEVGGVVVNEVPGFRSDIMPYGGVKDSGIGREGPRFAIEELTVTKMAIIRPSVKES